MKLQAENVRFIESEIIDALILCDVPDELAAKTLAYIDGVHMMANEVIKAIKEI